MTLFLTSSHCIPDADRAILNPANGLVDKLRENLPDHPRCLFVCSHPDSAEKTDWIAHETADIFAEAGMPFSGLDVLDGRTADRAAELVAKSQFIVLCGGHVPTQNAFFQKIGLRRLLWDYQGAVMGISAGTMNAADVVYAQPELPGESIDLHYERFLPGLGLTEVMLLSHYQKERHTLLDGKRLYEDITYADSMGHTFYALPDGSWLYQKDGKAEIRGEAYRIRNGEIKCIAHTGDATAVR